MFLGSPDSCRCGDLGGYVQPSLFLHSASILGSYGLCIYSQLNHSLAVILFVRTWALYNRNMKLLYAFCAMWIVSILFVLLQLTRL